MNKKGNILIVDDDREVIDKLVEVMKIEYFDYNIHSCSDGDSAIRLCESERPKVVVLDMMLPKRSGFLVMESIKKQELKSNPYVIMITANEGMRHREYAERLGADAYLLKPIRIETLFRHVQKGLEDELD